MESPRPPVPVALRDDDGLYPIFRLIAEQGLEDDTAAPRIRCPHCFWQPRPDSLWYCVDCGPPEYFLGGCGTAWNTFDTRGRCPGCGHQWIWTVCLACDRWARHEDWYVKEEPGKAG